MAVNWLWKDKMGFVRFERTDRKTGKKRRFNVNIYAANCLCAFIYEYKDEETKKDMYNFWGFWSDEKHAKNILKDSGGLFWNERVVSIKLNMAYSYSKKILDLAVKAGYTVKCYYKEIK